MRSLKGKVALVTGAASGIGRATATALARQGARLILCDVNEPALAAVADEIAGLGEAVLDGLLVAADETLSLAL